MYIYSHGVLLTYKNLEMEEKQPLNGLPTHIIKGWKMAFHNLHSVLLDQIYGKWQMSTIEEKVNWVLELLKFWSDNTLKRKLTLHVNTFILHCLP